MNYIHYYDSPLGKITLASEGIHLIGLWFENQNYYGSTLSFPIEEKNLPIFHETSLWLNDYFKGVLPTSIPPIKLYTTPFRKNVYDTLLTIPYGTTTTYGEIASQISKKKMSAQAVGNAIGHNPISIIIPCHRVIGKDGSLVGYAAGLERKKRLLQLENILL